MLFKLLKYQLAWQGFRSWVGFPYISLLFWILPLLLFNSGHSSLMAHDEGLYAWRSRQMFDSGNWINPWSQTHHKTPGPYWLIASSYTLFGISEVSVLAILLLLTGSLIYILGSDEIRKYATVGLALGCGCLILPLVWIGRYCFGQKFLNSNYWLAGWLIPGWLALAVVGSHGFLSDYNPDMRSFLVQPAIAQILQNHSIQFVKVAGKTGVLLDFYTPHHGDDVDTISELPVYSYAWISPQRVTDLSTPHRVLGTVQKHQLIQILPRSVQPTIVPPQPKT